jgi:hypothetical protein
MVMPLNIFNLDGYAVDSQGRSDRGCDTPPSQLRRFEHFRLIHEKLALINQVKNIENP